MFKTPAGVESSDPPPKQTNKQKNKLTMKINLATAVHYVVYLVSQHVNHAAAAVLAVAPFAAWRR